MKNEEFEKKGEEKKKMETQLLSLLFRGTLCKTEELGRRNVQVVRRSELGSIDEEVDDTVGVTPLVIVPGDELDKGRVELDSSLGIKDGAELASAEIAGNDLLVGVAEDTLHLALRSSLDGGADVFVGGGSLELAGEIDDRDIEGGDTEGHASELAVEVGDDLADSLGSTSGRGDDVAGSSTTVTPGLGRRTIDSLLGGSGGVDSGHETTDDAILVMDDLGKRSKAVGGARGVGDDLVLLGELGVVDTIDEHGCILGRSSDEDLLCTSVEVRLALLEGGEDTRGLDDPFNTTLTPLAVGRVLLSKAEDLVVLAIVVNDKLVVLALDSAGETAVHGIILEHVCHGISLQEGIVESNELDGHATLDEDTSDETADTTETIDSDLGCHESC